MGKNIEPLAHIGRVFDGLVLSAKFPLRAGHPLVGPVNDLEGEATLPPRGDHQPAAGVRRIGLRMDRAPPGGRDRSPSRPGRASRGDTLRVDAWAGRKPGPAHSGIRGAKAEPSPAADGPHRRWHRACEPSPSSVARPGWVDAVGPRAEGGTIEAAQPRLHRCARHEKSGCNCSQAHPGIRGRLVVTALIMPSFTSAEVIGRRSARSYSGH